MPSNCGGLIFEYGDYQHKLGEVYPAAIEVRPARSKYGIKWASLYRIQIKGDFIADDGTELGPTEITTRINELQDVYIRDYKDAGFLLSDGTRTPHYMETNNQYNLSGNHVTSRSWDHIHPANEYANTRSFTVAIDSVFEQDESLGILYFKENVKKRGTGGPIYRWYNTWSGVPISQQISSYSVVSHVQSGVIVGMNTWPTPPPPYWPTEELIEKQVVIQESPDHFGRETMDKPKRYVTRYTYFFERAGYDPIQQLPWYFG